MIELIEEVTSTNDIARERAWEGAAHGYAVRALRQMTGRGQRGHGWSSPAGGLYLSVILRPDVPQHLMTGLPIACGLGALRALDSLGIQGVRLKWPNDLVAGDAKLAGMLTEAGWSDGAVFAVCGIGINMTAPEVADAPPHALAPCGLESLLPEGTSLPALDELAEAVRTGMVASVDAWADCLRAAGASALPLTGIMDEFFDRLAFMGEYVALIDREGNPYAAGTLTGVDAWGRACVQIDGGEEETFDPAQVSIRPLR